MAWGDLSRDIFHYNIQDSVVITARGGESWIEQGGGTRGGINDETLENFLMSVPVVVDGGEDDYLCRRGCCVAGGGTSTIITPLKGLRNVPNDLCSFPPNNILAYFLIIILTH